MHRTLIAVLGAAVVAAAAFIVFSGALGAAAGAWSGGQVATMGRHDAPSPNPTASQSSGTDADCKGDQNGNQQNGDSSHQFPAGSVPAGHQQNCPPPAVPEVPSAAVLFSLLALVGLGFLFKTGHLRLPLPGNA